LNSIDQLKRERATLAPFPTVTNQHESFHSGLVSGSSGFPPGTVAADDR
jgi:hypothetical protein